MEEIAQNLAKDPPTVGPMVCAERFSVLTPGPARREVTSCAQRLIER
jgi:hypothetical protein